MASPTQNTSTSPTASTAKSTDRHHANLTTLPEARQQSYEEIYGPPENLLEIEVRPSFETAAPSAIILCKIGNQLTGDFRYEIHEHTAPAEACTPTTKSTW